MYIQDARMRRDVDASCYAMLEDDTYSLLTALALTPPNLSGVASMTCLISPRYLSPSTPINAFNTASLPNPKSFTTKSMSLGLNGAFLLFAATRCTLLGSALSFAALAASASSRSRILSNILHMALNPASYPPLAAFLNPHTPEEVHITISCLWLVRVRMVLLCDVRQ